VCSRNLMDMGFKRDAMATSSRCVRYAASSKETGELRCGECGKSHCIQRVSTVGWYPNSMRLRDRVAQSRPQYPGRQRRFRLPSPEEQSFSKRQDAPLRHNSSDTSATPLPDSWPEYVDDSWRSDREPFPTCCLKADCNGAGLPFGSDVRIGAHRLRLV